MSIQLTSAAKHFQELPHQIAAWNWLQQQIPASVLAEFAETYRATPALKESQVQTKRPIRIPYYSQRDSQVPGQALRMCFSSSCAMMLAALKPGVISGPNADDIYLKRVNTFGDSTDAGAQIKALNSFGLQARFVTNASWQTLENQLSKGIPVPCGFLHRGSVGRPTGGGHWLCVYDMTPTHVLVNDPFGEMDVVAGTYISSKGQGLAYSKKNWGPRWLVEGNSSGWCIIAEP